MKTKPNIMHLLQMDELQYAEEVEQFGIVYAKFYCYQIKGEAELMIQTKSYWEWWKKHFDIRDEIFLKDFGCYADTTVVNYLRLMWAEQHQPERLTGKIPTIVWDEILKNLKQEKPEYAKV